MHDTTRQRLRLLAPLLVLGVVVVLVVLEGRSGESPAAAPHPVAPGPRATSEEGPTVLVGTRDAAPRRSSTLTHEDLVRLDTYKKTAWDVARRIVAEGEVAVPVLVQALLSPDRDLRGGAAKGLLLVPAPATAGLLAQLDRTEGEARGRVLGVLAQLQHWWAAHDVGAEVVPRLAELLRSGDAKEKKQAAGLIANAGPHTALGLGPFLEALRTTEGEAFRDLVMTSTALGRSQASDLCAVLVERLVHLLGQTLDDDPTIGTLIEAIERVGPPTAADISRLAACVPDAPEKRRRLMAWMFEPWGEAAAHIVPDLTRLLSDEHAHDGALASLLAIPGGERAVVTHLVGSAEGPEATRYLFGDIAKWGPRFERVLVWLLETARTGEGSARAGAIRVLGLAPPAYAARVAPAMIDAFGSEDEALRLAVVNAFARPKREFPGEWDVIVAALRDESPQIRHMALIWFRYRSEHSGNEEHAALVAPLLGDPVDDIRFWAGNVLKDIGTAPASALADARSNLLHEERLVRLGAMRALVTLGPAAADAVPEMIEAILDTSRDTFGLWPLAETGVFDERVQDAVREYMERNRFGVGSVLGCFEERAAVFEPEMRGHFLANPKCGELYALAKVTSDPEGFADWLLTNEKRFKPRDVLSALRSLDEVGLPALLEKVREEPRHADQVIETASRALGEKALPALLADLETAEGEDRARVLRFLTVAAPEQAVDVFFDELSSVEGDVRAQAALGLTAAFGQGATPDARLAALVERTQDEHASVRDAAWQALRAADHATGALLARAERALRDESVQVRVAAAEALLALGGHREKAFAELVAVLEVPAPYWGWIGGGGTAARSEADYAPTAQLWARAARALETMGEDAAPAATTLVWAAIRHGEPRMQRTLLGPIEAMGKAAEPVLPLLDRLAGHHGTWLGYHETVPELTDRLRTIYRFFDRKRPTPDDDWLIEVE